MKDIRIVLSGVLLASLLAAAPGFASSSSDSSSSSSNCVRKGERGRRGPDGRQGRPGDTGIQGNIGNQGPQGPQGPDGPQGPQGDPQGSVYTPICAENGAQSIFGLIPITDGAGAGDGYSYSVLNGVVTISPTLCPGSNFTVIATAVDPFGKKIPVNVGTGTGCTFTLTPSDDDIDAISFIAFACNPPPDMGGTNE